MKTRPRNYGEPTDRGYEKAMDALTDKVAAVRSEAGQRLLSERIDQLPDLMKDDNREGLDLEELRDEALSYAILIQDTLPRCEPIYITSDVSAILDAARQGLPEFELRESDLLVPNGFVWFETPIVNFWEDDDLTGFAWMTGAKSKNIFAWLYSVDGPNTGTPTPMTFPGEGEMVDYEFPIARLLVAFWLLAKQELLATQRERPSRAVRRRASRISEIKTVVVITLRRSSSLSESSPDGARKIGRDHRYLVRGFWRNQWYPSEGRNRPKWINDFFKGDPDKPFVAKRRAFEFRR